VRVHKGRCASQSVRGGCHVIIVLEVRDNEHGLPCPTHRGSDPTVESDETESVDRERGAESSNRNENRPLHDNQWTLVQNPRRAWKK
jgi:hypothetical protein